jgi:hypothetical protein
MLFTAIFLAVACYKTNHYHEKTPYILHYGYIAGLQQLC